MSVYDVTAFGGVEGVNDFVMTIKKLLKSDDWERRGKKTSKVA